jgi:hypothetical protein
MVFALSFVLGVLGACPAVVRGSDLRQQTPPTLVVQIVDDAWLPVPGVTVDVGEIGPQSKGDTPTASEASNQEGLACFAVPDARSYILAVRGGDVFAKKKPLRIRLIQHSKEHPTAYVQVRLHLTKPPMVYVE